MAYDFSISETDIARELGYGKKIILEDGEIISYLRTKLSFKESNSTREYCRIILVNIDGIPHILSSESGDFLSYHVLIASAYSLTHEKCGLKICGGGYLSLEKYHDIETISIEGDSKSFGKMNFFYLEEVFSRLGVKVEIDKGKGEISTETIYRDYSYDQILHISKNM